MTVEIPEPLWTKLIEISEGLAGLERGLAEHVKSDRDRFEAHLEAIKALTETKADRLDHTETKQRLRGLEVRYYVILASLLATVGVSFRGFLP